MMLHEPPVETTLTQPIETLVNSTPVVIDPQTTVAEAASEMRKHRITSILINSDPLGILTDRDLRNRVVAEALDPQTPVSQVMTCPIRAIPADTPIYGALMYTLQEGIHHLPLSRNGEIVGVVTNGDILRHQVKSPVYLMQHIRRASEPAVLSSYANDIAGTISGLYYGGLNVSQIGRIVASLNDALAVRLLKLTEKNLGPPPTPYAWVVFGSEGRMEQAVLTDQDNALIYEEDVPGAKEYFKALSQQVNDGLVQAGFPPCPGGYMAVNWHMSLPEWQRLFRKWVETPEPQALLEASIFFDFRPVYGTLSLESLEQIVLKAKKSGIFIAQMARNSLSFTPPLNFFRWIVRDANGMIDLKKGGVAPIVGLARTYALQGGARNRSTLERLQAAVAADTLSRHGADELIDTYQFLLGLRLREQLAKINHNETPTNLIDINELSRRDKRRLKEAFLVIKSMQEATSSRFRTDQLG